MGISDVGSKNQEKVFAEVELVDMRYEGVPFDRRGSTKFKLIKSLISLGESKSQINCRMRLNSKDEARGTKETHRGESKAEKKFAFILSGSET